MSTFTLDTLREAQRKLEAIGPIPFWASHTLLPANKAYRFTFRNVEYVGAHPDFWAQLPAVNIDAPVPFGITIRNLDLHQDDRAQFYDALAGVIAAGGAA